MRRLLGPALLLLVWIDLWGELSVANVVSGLAVVGLAVAIDARLRGPRRHRIRFVGIVLLVVDLLRRLVVSSLQLVRTILVPTESRLRSGVVSVPLSTDSELVATVVADLISLTPGTLTLDARPSPPRLVVHVLGLDDPSEVRDEVAALERKVLRAVQPLPVRPGEGVQP